MSDSEEEFGTGIASEKAKYPSSNGLFDDSDSDSDSDSNEEENNVKASAKSEKIEATKKKRLQKKRKISNVKSKVKTEDNSMSKKERMEALVKKRNEAMNVGVKKTLRKEEKNTEKKSNDKNDKGYDSGDSYNSAEFERTKEDDDFIDATGEDPDALRELYAEQHFEDEQPDDDMEEVRKKKVPGKGAPRRSGPDQLSEDEDGVNSSNPLTAIVYKMKKKKKNKKKLSEIEEEAKEFLDRMDAAADEDEKLMQEKRPATKKLVMLPKVLEVLTNKEFMRPLLDYDLLTVVRRWVQPLSNGKLGNVTVRQRLFESISNMNGEQGIIASDLKRSSLGKTVMALYTHKSETPRMKRLLKDLIEQWSRPIFQKSGNMRDLNSVLQGRREHGISGIARAQQTSNQTSSPAQKARFSLNDKTSHRGKHDLSSVIAGHSKATLGLGNNRVRIPYSKGFQFTIRPAGKVSQAPKKKQFSTDEGRGFLQKRMLDKNRKHAKNQRSSTLSVEGKDVK